MQGGKAHCARRRLSLGDDRVALFSEQHGVQKLFHARVVRRVDEFVEFGACDVLVFLPGGENLARSAVHLRQEFFARRFEVFATAEEVFRLLLVPARKRGEKGEGAAYGGRFEEVCLRLGAGDAFLPQAAAYPVQLAVGAREHGDLAEGALLFLPPPGEHVQSARHLSDFLGDEDALRQLAPAFGEAHLGSRGQGRAQRPLAIVFGYGAQGAFDDFGSRTVVFCQPHEICLRKVPLQPFKDIRRRAAEGVDRLVGVADDKERIAFARPLPNKFVLLFVHVLEFVDEQAAEAFARNFARERLVYDVVEVQRARRAQAAGVFADAIVRLAHAVFGGGNLAQKRIRRTLPPEIAENRLRRLYLQGAARGGKFRF